MSWHARFKNTVSKWKPKKQKVHTGLIPPKIALANNSIFTYGQFWRLWRKKMRAIFNSVVYSLFFMGASALTQRCGYFPSLLILRRLFSLVIGVAFILADKSSRERGREPSASYHFPYFLAPDKARQCCWRLCISDQRASELSAAMASSATWLLRDRFVPLIREYSDCRLCLCTESDWGRRRKNSDIMSRERQARRRARKKCLIHVIFRYLYLIGHNPLKYKALLLF